MKRTLLGLLLTCYLASLLVWPWLWTFGAAYLLVSVFPRVVASSWRPMKGERPVATVGEANGGEPKRSVPSASEFWNASSLDDRVAASNAMHWLVIDVLGQGGSGGGSGRGPGGRPGDGPTAPPAREDR